MQKRETLSSTSGTLARAAIIVRRKYVVQLWRVNDAKHCRFAVGKSEIKILRIEQKAAMVIQHLAMHEGYRELKISA